MYIWKARWR